MVAPLPAELLKSITQGQLVVFAGSGASAPTGRPTWQSLMENLVEIASKEGLPVVTSEGLRELMRLSKDIAHVKLVPQIIWSSLRRVFGHNGEGIYFECVRQALANEQAAPASSYHRLLLDLHPYCVLTTNYDPCFETASGERGGDWKEMILRELSPEWESDGLLKDVIYHIHGSQTDGKERTMVLSLKDYGDLYRKDPQASLFLRQAFSTSNVLFFGASMNDEEILAEFYENMGEGPHWALVPKNSKEAALFRAMGVHAVDYEFEAASKTNKWRANHFGAEQVLSHWATSANSVLKQVKKGVA
ncbi:MAG: hypothetical protein EON58_01975 [Alphaproteobacteria bacterium]|nr:MAG: hypothetical protein EON58_01975 [Alphaproteobacteria bacterium]